MKRDELLKIRTHAISYSIFEIVWPTFEWIKQINLDIIGNKYTFHVQHNEKIAQREIDDCTRLLMEIFAQAYNDYGVDYILIFEENTNHDKMYVAVMNEKLFQLMAEEVAPWRLEDGR